MSKFYMRKQKIHVHWIGGAAMNNATNYLYCANVHSATNQVSTAEKTNATIWFSSCKGTLKNMGVSIVNAAGAGEDFVFTVRKNAADTGLTVTISGATELIDSDTTNTVDVDEDDYIAVKVVGSAGANANTRASVMFLFETDD